jgi:hypothetical protein
MTPDWYQENDFPGRFRYTVTRPVHFLLAELKDDYDIKSLKGNVLAIVRDQLLSILPGYSFDGATSAPDIKRLMRGVVLHDILCQLCECPGWPMTRFAADKAFYRVAREDAPLIATVYYAGIRIGGHLHRFFNPPNLCDGIKFLRV